MEPVLESEALRLFPGESCALTPLPGVARVVHSKASCTVHWQEGSRCKQSAKDAHPLPPAQILGIQSGQGTARGQVKCPRGGADGKGAVRPPPCTDQSQSSEESSPECAPGDGPGAGVSSPDAPDRLAGLEKPPGTEAGDSAAREPGPGCACGQLPELEDELSLLDPLPRYMKSCQHLIIPEQCRCSSPESRVPSAAAAPAHSPPRPEPQPHPGLPPDACTPDVADAPAEELQEKGSPLDPTLPQGQAATKPSKDVPSSGLAQQLRTEGWGLQSSESLTLAEVYLMMGKPSKLQLEYDWLAVRGAEPGAEPAPCHQQRLLRCLLKLISTEVNPRPVGAGGSLAGPCGAQAGAGARANQDLGAAEGPWG